MSNNTTAWTAWHLHISTVGSMATDQVVRHVVAPATDGLSGGAWFFVRYWQFGPHVRLRVADLTPRQADEFEAQLRVGMAELAAAAGPAITDADYLAVAGPLAAAGEGAGELDTGHLWPAGVYRQPYQPETARYGGSGLMGESESLFHVSSELALGFLRLCPPERARSGLGVVATRAALDVLADDDRRLRVCRRAAAGWRQWWQRAGGEELPRSPGESPPPGTAPAPVRRWVAGLRAALPRWQDEAGEEEAERILQSHIHMLHNRLGLSVAQEQAHYLVLAAPPVPASAVPT